MNNFKTIGLLVVSLFVLGACTGDKVNGTLVFGQVQTLGIGISTAPTPGLTLGYKDANIALIPVAGADGSMYGGSQCAFAPEKDGDEDFQSICDEDTLSVIGQFEVDADAQGNVGLGKFFATGHAANSISEGFKAKLSREVDSE